MYHCRIHFYLISPQRDIWDTIKKMPPLEHFTHEFSIGTMPEPEPAAEADVIFADIRNTDAAQTLHALAVSKREDAALILLAEKAQISSIAGDLCAVKDIWTMPMSEEELRFRFLRWQQACKTDKDFWQTSHFLDAAINSSPNLIWYKDKNGIHEKVNDSFCKTAGKTKSQIEGRGHAYIWDVEHDDPACIESEREVMTKRKTFVSEESIQTGDGEKLLTTYKSPLYDLDGSVMGTVGVAIDVTQERAYETEITQKNHTLETIFTTLDCGVICHSIDGSKILSINRAALDILGYHSKEEMEMTGFKMVADSVLDEDKVVLRDAIQGLKKEGDSASVEYRVQHSDGKLLHVMGSVKLLKESGTPFYQRFLLDCTEQKLQEEEEQQEQERRHSELIQALGIDYNLICCFNLDTGTGSTLRIHNCNYNVLGTIFSKELQLENSMERYIQTCVYANDREMLRHAVSCENLEKELTKKPTYYVNYRTLCHNEIRCFQMKAVRAGSWKQNHSAVLGFCSIDEEIRREMEKKSLLENALMQANNANMAKSAFLSNMSHDIRTPMNAIMGFTNLAHTNIDHKDQVEEYLNKIMVSGKHLLSLINNVLDMSHLESGTIHLDEQPCNLPKLLQELCDTIQSEICTKQLQLQIDTAGVLHEDVYCDKRLNQALLNILNNAIKYTGEGGSIHVALTEKPGVSADFANYTFCIKDTGIGMSKEFLSHIFDPFERERNSTISGIQGSGLGMAITKNLVDLMNGSITVESGKDAGSEVTVSFTFRLHSAVDTQETQEENPSGEPSVTRTGRVLLVEDNEINQEIAAEILKGAGFSVEIADNGQIGLDMLKNAGSGYYQLVLMDIQMPVMNGYEATRAIRALNNPELSSIPIIAVTANAFEEDKREALNQGMNAYVAKPIDVDLLFDTLDKILYPQAQ